MWAVYFRITYQVQLALFTTVSLVAIVALAQEPVQMSHTVDVIEWPADSRSGAPATEGMLSRASATHLPVLVPERFLAFKTLDLVNDPLSYTASVLAIDAKQSISGTRVSFHDSSDTNPAIEAETVDIKSAEHSIFASFKRYGAAYIVVIECRRPEDTRCTEVDYIHNLVKDMEVIGGARGDPDPLLLKFGVDAPRPTRDSADPLFTYRPPGELLPGSGTGVTSPTIYAAGIRFPIEQPKAYLNSQVYGIGGSHGSPGSWKDPRNYAYPWRDNFCETRKWQTPACPSGAGHQGVDIRPSGPEDKTHWVVAVEDGRISNVGIFSVSLTGVSTTQYRYLHLEMAQLAIKQGDLVKRGQRIGLVSDDFGGASTPVHLHFEILQNANGRGFVHRPPYSSLVRAYQSFD